MNQSCVVCENAKIIFDFGHSSYDVCTYELLKYRPATKILADFWSTLAILANQWKETSKLKKKSYDNGFVVKHWF